LLQVIAFIIEILPIFLYLLFYKRNRGEGIWVIFLYCCISPLAEPLFSKNLHLHISDHYLDAGFTIMEFTCCSLFMLFAYQRKQFKYVLLLGALIFYPVAFINFTHAEEGFDSIPASVEAIIIISYCILLLYEQISDPKVIFVYNTKKFWITIAFFLYFSSTLFLFLFARNLTQSEHDKYWMINDFFDILKNILFSVSFIMKKSVKNPYPQDFDGENLNLNM
jgi:hypothetical protein